MFAIEIAVRVHHLRLHPDAEVHAQCMHAIDDGLEAVGKLLLVHIPVAQAGVVVLALAEPSIIDNETLYAHFGGLLGEGNLPSLADIEFRGFPGVIEDGPQSSFLAAGQDGLPLKAMQDPRCLTETSVRESAIERGSFETLARFETVSEVEGV